MEHVLCRMVDTGETIRFAVLGAWMKRARGLLGTDMNAEPVVLVPCSSVHTFGMRYALDVAFLSRDGKVLRSVRSVPPGRLVWAFGAYCTLERPSSDEPWPACGSWVVIEEMRGSHETMHV